MARIEFDQDGFGTHHLLRNVRVKSRHSSLEERITWDTNKGAIQKRPGRERQQEKWVRDAPVMELLLSEYLARVEDSIKVITRGWQLATEEPVEVWTGDLLLDVSTGVLSMSAKVESNNVATTCGFIIDITPAFDTALAIPANETPVQSLVPEKITASMDLTLYAGMNFYVLPYATDGSKTAYGIIKHIELPAVLPQV